MLALVRSRAAPLAVRPLAASQRGLSLLAPDQTTPEFKFYHKTHLAMLGLVPLALVAPTSALTTPLDLLLAVAIPVHGHIGMNWVITDYVPPAFQAGARAGMLLASTLAVAGLVKLSLDEEGPGFIGSLKALWNKPQAKSAEKKTH